MFHIYFKTMYQFLFAKESTISLVFILLANSFSMPIIETSLNLSWAIVDRIQVLILRKAEKERSHVAELIGIVNATCRSLYRFGYNVIDIPVFKSSKEFCFLPDVKVIQFLATVTSDLRLLLFIPNKS